MTGQAPANAASGASDDLTPVMALHALVYCERLFYLEEVEGIRLANDRVLSGRMEHEARSAEPDVTELRDVEVRSERLKLYGRVDALRRRDGSWVAYEHKRGRCARNEHGDPVAWPADRVQIGAYALLLEETLGEAVLEGRVRYHASGVTVRVPVDADVRSAVEAAVQRASELRASPQRPPVTDNPRLCVHCSLAPVCLPEEARLAREPMRRPLRLFPPVPEGAVVHVSGDEARVQRRANSLVVVTPEAEEQRLPIHDVAALILHGHAQITTQAIHLCAAEGVPVHWVTRGGRYLGCIAGSGLGVQRKLRQYRALTDGALCLDLAKRLVAAKIDNQLRFLLRASRGSPKTRADITPTLHQVREALARVPTASTSDHLLGLEGIAGRAYFEALPKLLTGGDAAMRPAGRTRRPPRDPFNAALSFLYTLLYRSVLQSVLVVGLEPALGFFHRPRSSSPPLVLDLVELFRVPLCDMPLVASVNRGQWRPEHFDVTREHVWLSAEGRRVAIDLYERRLADTWKHPVLGYSLSYARSIELEVRLLEKEWSGEPGLFARSRLR